MVKSVIMFCIEFSVGFDAVMRQEPMVQICLLNKQCQLIIPLATDVRIHFAVPHSGVTEPQL